MGAPEWNTSMGLLRFLHFYCIRSFFFPSLLHGEKKKKTLCSQNLASPVKAVKDLIKINKITKVVNKSKCLHRAQGMAHEDN